MSREKPEYRDNLEDLLSYFDGRRLLSKKDVAAYMGKDPRTVAKLYNIPRDGITAPTLARRMCG